VTLRRLAVLVAFSFLLLFFLRRISVQEIRGRLGNLRRSASQDLRTRRGEGLSAAYDRRFYSEFLSSVRRALPRGCQGLALYAPGVPEWGGLYLAVYDFAPLPVAIAPQRVPAGWVAAVYGPERPAGWKLLRDLPNGALLDPP